MNKARLLKISIPLLFLLAIVLGLSSRKLAPYLGSNRQSYKVQHLPASGDKQLTDFYRQSQKLAREKDQKTTATFLSVGDIMLSRSVAREIKNANNPLLPFSKMADILKSTNFNFANLESPISGSNSFNGTGSMVFNAPKDYTQGLKNYNFQIVNLANNHALDQSAKGLFNTIGFLDGLGIKHVGVGKTLEEAWQPARVEANGIEICFIGASYASVNDNGKTTNNYVARIEDIENLKLKIENSKSQCDLVIATMHAGTEYTRKPNADQIKFAHTAIDYGADMVIGAHPHWVQTIEKYQNKYIFYSLGNFIFDQEWSRDTKEGLALKIRISKSEIQNTTAPGAATLNDLQGPRQPAKLEQIELIPVVIENYSTPRPATADEEKKILDKIGETEKILR